MRRAGHRVLVDAGGGIEAAGDEVGAVEPVAGRSHDHATGIETAERPEVGSEAPDGGGVTQLDEQVEAPSVHRHHVGAQCCAPAGRARPSAEEDPVDRPESPAGSARRRLGGR